MNGDDIFSNATADLEFRFIGDYDLLYGKRLLFHNPVTDRQRISTVNESTPDLFLN